MAHPTMPTLFEPLVQRPRGYPSSSIHDEFAQTGTHQVEKLVQGPVTYKRRIQTPRFTPLGDGDWGAW